MNQDGNFSDAAPLGELLFICTANISRSPTAELLLKHRLSPGLFKGVLILSSGVHAIPDSPIDPVMAAVLNSEGIDSSTFRAQQLTTDQILRATVILTATTEHRSQIVRQSISARKKTFTMIEFAHLLNHSPRNVSSRGSLDECLARASAARFAGTGSLRQLSIEDPYGRGRKAYRAALRSLRSITEGIAEALEER